MTQSLDDAEVGVVRQVEVHRPQSGRLGERDEAAWGAVDDGADGQAVRLLPPEEGTNHRYFSYRIERDCPACPTACTTGQMFI